MFVMLISLMLIFCAEGIVLLVSSVSLLSSRECTGCEVVQIMETISLKAFLVSFCFQTV